MIRLDEILPPALTIGIDAGRFTRAPGITCTSVTHSLSSIGGIWRTRRRHWAQCLWVQNLRQLDAVSAQA